jgi:hypothetical protein
MSEAQKRLQDALGRQAESYEDRQAREAQERADAEAFFGQTIVPAFEAAANEINQRAATNQSTHEPPPRAEVRQRPRSQDAMSIELGVRRGGIAEFWFFGMARTRELPIQWRYPRNPRLKSDGTPTSEGTERELKWNVSMAETTSDQIRDDLLNRYAEVLDARTRRRGR